MNRPSATRSATPPAAETRKLSDLVNAGDPPAIIAEVCHLLDQMRMGGLVPTVDQAFAVVLDLFEGRFPGYRPCNTEYHDLRHTTDVFLTTARMVHGAVAGGTALHPRQVATVLISALGHDTGYIQETSDTEGTGAKHTVRHVARSIEFLDRHRDRFGLSPEEVEAGQVMILCTDLAVDIETLAFADETMELLAKILGGADLLAQMADRTYLEKLLFLYREFVEAGVGGFENERDLLEKTISFYDAFERRLTDVLGGTDRFLRTHFETRWQIPKDLYRESIDNQKHYLQTILSQPERDHREFLKRDGIVARLRRGPDDTPEASV